jgi:RNA-binding protein PNO1
MSSRVSGAGASASSSSGVKPNRKEEEEEMDEEEEPMDEEEVARGKKQRGASGQSIVKPNFPALSAQQAAGGKAEFRRVQVPPHRYTPLRKDWMQIYTPIVEHLKLDVRMNPRNRSVEIKTSTHTDDVDTLQKAADFVRAYLLGFEVGDAVALLRVEDLFVDTFQVTDVKILKGDHLSRAVGRIAGKDGKCKYAIENATKTRIILAESRVHILGSFANIKMARDAICALILGSPISKVYTNLRGAAARLSR